MNVVSVSRQKRALITGASGFTGRYLVEELTAAGYEVVGTTHDEEKSLSNSYLHVDLCNQTEVRKLIHDVKPEVVAHLAAISFVNEGDLARIYETNFLGSFYLLDALNSIQPDTVRAVMLASSANIYGNNPKETLNEVEIPDPVNEYAVSKYAMEKMAKLWVNRLPLFIVRPFNYTGVGQNAKFLIPKIVNHFKQKKATIELGNTGVWREFNDVRFVVSIYRQLLENGAIGETLNICTGVSYSLNDVIALSQEITGHQINVVVNPEFVRTNEVRVLQGDNSRLKQIIKNWNVPNLKDTLTWMLHEKS